MKKENIYLIVVILVSIAGGVVFLLSGKAIINSKKQEDIKGLVDCLLAKNVKLYISSDCSYCSQQKEIFGEYFSKIDYVNCEENGDWSEDCRKEEINSVPTWVFPDNTDIVKEEISSCSDCQKTGTIKCTDYCYTESKDGKSLRISGILDINKLNGIFRCKED